MSQEHLPQLGVDVVLARAPLDSPLGELAELIGGFDEAQLRQLRNVARAMRIEVEHTLHEGSDIVSEAFNNEMCARLQTHHGTHTQPLDRISWEDAFRAGMEQDGRTVTAALSATNRFYDIRVDEENIALKSTKAKSVSKTTIHISKLCEAAWIQDARSKTLRRDATFRMIRAFQDSVDRILQLRVIPDLIHWRYELVEVPLRLFAGVFDLNLNAFNADGPRLDVRDAEGAAMKLVIDRSDSKITIAGVPKSRCVVHALWVLPKDMRLTRIENEE